MLIAVSVIAACSIIRIIQNGIQLHMLIRDTDARNKTYREVIKSAGRTEKQIIREFLEEAEEHMKKNERKENASCHV